MEVVYTEVEAPEIRERRVETKSLIIPVLKFESTEHVLVLPIAQ